MNHNLEKGFAMPIVVGVIAVVLVLGGVVYYMNQPDEAEMMSEDEMMEKESMEEEEDEAMMDKKNDEMMEDNSMMEKENEEAMMKYSGEILAGKSSPLLDFTKADYDTAIKTDKLVVLYFYANWCPICRAEFPVMQKAFDELTTNKVIGFRVNYNDNQTDDDEKNLAKQFGVAYQHTKVFVKNGERTLKSPETWDQSRYNMEISKALTQ